MGACGRTGPGPSCTQTSRHHARLRNGNGSPGTVVGIVCSCKSTYQPGLGYPGTLTLSGHCQTPKLRKNYSLNFS